MEAQAAEVAAKSKDETDLEQAGTALSKAELEMQKVELLSRIDAEKAREDLDEARATLTQLKETFDLKRKAAQASIRVLEIQRGSHAGNHAARADQRLVDGDSLADRRHRCLQHYLEARKYGRGAGG